MVGVLVGGTVAEWRLRAQESASAGLDRGELIGAETASHSWLKPLRMRSAERRKRQPSLRMRSAERRKRQRPPRMRSAERPNRQLPLRLRSAERER